MDPVAAIKALEEILKQARENGTTPEERAELLWALEGLARWIDDGGFLTEKDK